MLEPEKNRGGIAQTDHSALPSDPQLRGGWLARIRYLGFLALVSVVVASVITVTFCPPFVLWRGLVTKSQGDWVPLAWNTPETNRATSTLEQIENPFAPIRMVSNWVIAWRLFFPLIWHYLALPVWLLLILPHMGCLFTLGLIAHIVYRRTSNRWWTLFATVVIGACPWFFVSSAWLTYFDSWIMAGLLVLAFCESRTAIVLVCLFMPWIEERLLLAAPLCMVIRAIDSGSKELRWDKKLFWDGMAMLIPSLLYPVGRIVLAMTVLHGGETSSYVDKYFSIKTILSVKPEQFLRGIWFGIRVGWVFVAASFWMLWTVDRRQWKWIAAAVFGVTLVIGLVVAADLSRNICLVLPFALMGILELARYRPDVLRVVLPVAAAASLLLPAYHVITLFSVPIVSINKEIDHLHHLPRHVDPAFYVQQGVDLFNRNRLDEAKFWLDNALRLDEENGRAYCARAAVQLGLGDAKKAAEDVEKAIQLDPSDPDAYFWRAVMRRKDDPRGAAADLKNAIRVAPAEWNVLENAKKLLDKLNAEISQTAPKQ